MFFAIGLFVSLEDKCIQIKFITQIYIYIYCNIPIKYYYKPCTKAFVFFVFLFVCWFVCFFLGGSVFSEGLIVGGDFAFHIKQLKHQYIFEMGLRSW